MTAPVASPPLLLALHLTVDAPRDCARVPLTRDFCALIVAGARPLTCTSLGMSGVSELIAWNAAAQNLLALSSCPDGLRFFTRRRGPGLEVAVDGAPASAWLAHPRTFTVLRRHLAGLLGHPSPVFALGEQGSIVAYPSTKTASSAAPETRVIGWQRGFPTLLTT